jgi:ribonuclease I
MPIQMLAKHYNAIQIRMGNSTNTAWAKDINDLFSENFTKTANGQVLVNNRSELQQQITTCIEGAGLWTIQEKDIIPSKDGQKCTIRYIISTEKAGTFDVMALLTSADGQKIDSVDEVYYQQT